LRYNFLTTQWKVPDIQSPGKLSEDSGTSIENMLEDPQALGKRSEFLSQKIYFMSQFMSYDSSFVPNCHFDELITNFLSIKKRDKFKHMKKRGIIFNLLFLKF
jgi:hypothetical protein